MKKAILLIIALALLCATVSMHHAAHPFDTLCKENDLILSELKLTAWAKLSDTNYSKPQMLEVIQEIEARIGCKLETTCEEKAHLTTLKALAPGLTLLLTSIAVPHDKPKTYLSMEIKSLDFSEYRRHQALMDDIFNYYQTQPQSFETAIAYLQGKLSLAAQETIVDMLFHALDGIISEGITENDLVSYTGFSPHFANAIRVSDQDLNLNIASRYHNYQNRTYIYLGTPIIQCQY